MTADKNRIPRWLILQGEIDERYFILGQMLKSSKSQLPIEKMIDESTGYDKELLKQAQTIINEIEELKKEFYSLKKVSN